jgi:uncharacterized membrane protein (UPF0127 family)
MPAKDGETYTLRILPGLRTFFVETVVSPGALAKGLSGREKLPAGYGMLFVFPVVAVQSMWMPDMKFPLDIVWLDEHLCVTNLSLGAQPCARHAECPKYSSGSMVKYAIEMNAGEAKALGFKPGVVLTVL